MVSWSPVDLPEAWKKGYRQWIAEGREAGLGELSRALEVRLDPKLRFAWARSVMVLAAPQAYGDPGTPREGIRIGRVARRFWTREPDPFFLRRCLEPHVRALKEEACRLGVRARDYVEQGPLPVNLYAVNSGAFWRGFNALPLSQAWGSRALLTCLLTDIPVESARPHPDRCASCRRCLTSCPTGALLGDRRIDLNRCISYWTTRHQGVIALELWPAIGNWFFGCDVCQDVCPWNEKADRRQDHWCGFQPDPDLAHPDLSDFLTLSGGELARKYHDSAFERAGRVRMARNALIVIANLRDERHHWLIDRAVEDPAPLVRATAGQAFVLGGRTERAALLLRDPDEGVRQTIRAALG